VVGDARHHRAAAGALQVLDVEGVLVLRGEERVAEQAAELLVRVGLVNHRLDVGGIQPLDVVQQLAAGIGEAPGKHVEERVRGVHRGALCGGAADSGEHGRQEQRQDAEDGENGLGEHGSL
jgi:hypothetical protein